ncbi:hypothetical protein MYA_5883 [Burkholderia sp. KJ006]|nr:hypothetical protein MYA_5883 [Burkholderia sp. KJ006]
MPTARSAEAGVEWEAGAHRARFVPRSVRASPPSRGGHAILAGAAPIGCDGSMTVR